MFTPGLWDYENHLLHPALILEMTSPLLFRLWSVPSCSYSRYDLSHPVLSLYMICPILFLVYI